MQKDRKSQTMASLEGRMALGSIRLRCLRKLGPVLGIKS